MELNKRYHSTILCSEPAFKEEGVAETFAIRQVDCVAVKGKKLGVHIFEILGAKATVGPEVLATCEKHNKAMKLYFERQFELAAELFKQIVDDRAALMLYERCKHF